MKTVIASVAALIGTVYADANEVCGGPPITDAERAEIDKCRSDGWTNSCYRIEIRESCHANYDPSVWDSSWSDSSSSTGSTDWDGSSTEWSIDISGEGAEYVEPEETCENSWESDLSYLDNCLYRDWYTSTVCESEWYSYYGYDSTDESVC